MFNGSSTSVNDTLTLSCAIRILHLYYYGFPLHFSVAPHLLLHFLGKLVMLYLHPVLYGSALTHLLHHLVRSGDTRGIYHNYRLKCLGPRGKEPGQDNP